LRNGNIGLSRPKIAMVFPTPQFIRIRRWNMSACRPGENKDGKSNVAGRTPTIVASVIESDGLADDVRVSGELLTPKSIAAHDHDRAPFTYSPETKVRQVRLHAERAKEIVRDHTRPERFVVVVSRHVVFELAPEGLYA